MHEIQHLSRRGCQRKFQAMVKVHGIWFKYSQRRARGSTTINTMLNHRQSMKSVYSHPGPKRAYGETVYCSACNAELGPGACVRYSPITNDPFCSRHGRTVSRGLRRLVASEADLRLAVSRYPSILRFLDLNKIRLILQRRSKKT